MSTPFEGRSAAEDVVLRLESEVLCGLRRAWVGVGLILGLCAMPTAAAFAASYGSLSGSTVDYNDVADVNGLLGAPTLNNDDLDFSIDNLSAAAPLGGGWTTVSETLTLEVDAKGSAGMTGFEISISGRMDAASFLPNTTKAMFAFGNLFIDILEVDGQSVNAHQRQRGDVAQGHGRRA